MIPERCAPPLYAVMRIVFGLMFLTYGLQKFGIGGDAAPFFSYPFGIAGIIEVIVGVLVVLGLFTAPAAFIASGEMAVAFFSFHVLQFGWHPVQQHGDACGAVLLRVAVHRVPGLGHLERRRAAIAGLILCAVAGPVLAQWFVSYPRWGWETVPIKSLNCCVDRATPDDPARSRVIPRSSWRSPRLVGLSGGRAASRRGASAGPSSCPCSAASSHHAAACAAIAGWPGPGQPIRARHTS